MVIERLDSVQFRLKKSCDLSFLKRYGTAFCAIDETGSGCLCVGMEQNGVRRFCKVAGVDTVDAELSPAEAVKTLRDAVRLYRALAHPNLIRLVEHGPQGDFYVAVFDWADGECLFDHWNFQRYQENLVPRPADRFRLLPAEKKLKTVDVLFSFLEETARKGFVAVDFYDGSILYDFVTDTTTICDIDLFREKPARNDRGMDFFGTKRLKAPEEYVLGAVIDEATNVYTLGALIFDFFGRFEPDEIARRYEENCFFPCPLERWSLDKARYAVARTATQLDRERRYQTVAGFHSAWNSVCGR